ncbi:MAG TPA: glycosyltransferase [Candidatus Diapherotrites archaeon]|uniref:Glycosyltransferase n=1 Tax=Candidatus Iainarchaeum sp. TaxID=3101447 RepID=A0A7J4JHW2_9ARCH|nr:glycosyltransferase [Candidatus Diapherotrites archaeon]HIH16610.1 glycosyltransferase [Candidatus Diapherotrites archaeon]
MPVHAPGISLILVSRNEERHAPAFFKALQRQTRKPEEVILVDAFTDRMPEIAEPFVDQIVKALPPPGRDNAGFKRNIGVQHSSREIVAFTDFDAEPRPDWIEAIHRFFASHPEAKVMQGQVLIHSQDGSERGIFASGLAERGEFINCCNAAFHREVLEKNPFVEDIYWDDVELGYRLRGKYPVFGCRDAKVWHFGPLEKSGANQSLWKQCLRGSRGYVQLIRKYHNLHWIARAAYNIFYPLSWLQFKKFAFLFTAFWFAWYEELFGANRGD